MERKSRSSLWRTRSEKATSGPGYYRDQTLMFALDLLTVEQFFAQLYAHADLSAEPFFGGRSMTGHFATRLLDDAGKLPAANRPLQLRGRSFSDGVADAEARRDWPTRRSFTGGCPNSRTRAALFSSERQ